MAVFRSVDVMLYYSSYSLTLSIDFIAPFCRAVLSIARLIISQTSGNWIWKALIPLNMSQFHICCLPLQKALFLFSWDISRSGPVSLIWSCLARHLAIVIIISNKVITQFPMLLHINWIKRERKKSVKNYYILMRLWRARAGVVWQCKGVVPVVVIIFSDIAIL